MTMKVKDLIKMLSKYDGEASIELLAYGESSQNESTFEVDIETEGDTVILTAGQLISY